MNAQLSTQQPPVSFFDFDSQGISYRSTGRAALRVIGNITRFAMRTERSYCKGCCQVQQTKPEVTDTTNRIVCQACGWLIAEWPLQPVEQPKPAPMIATDQPASREMAAQWFKKMRDQAS
jgi:hypothetical protein